MKISLIVSDIDGTLTAPSADVEKGLKDLGEWIKKDSLPFTLASGRPLFLMKDLCHKLGVTLPVIACNGACSWEQTQGHIWNLFLNPAEMRAALELADQLGMAIIVSDGEQDWVYRQNDYIRAHIAKGEKWEVVRRPQNEGEWNDYQMQKLLIIDPQSPGKIDQVIEKMKEKEGNYQIVRYDDRGIEVMPLGCTKGTGVARLAGYLGVPLEEVLVLGDNANDMEMFQEAGCCAAVGNAVDLLKEKADYVSEKNWVYGVIDALKHFSIGE
ncbi:MAG TPA: Cof-type HAD-IIB family hydrolase [Candidatus Hungatella pullicola]|nr:Cof-type HAD-IIB family hydrolase [Candidatus Hungatella pullicola]